MGQQQLLLIVVGVIVVALAVVVGINQFGTAGKSGAVDAVVSAHQFIGTEALGYYTRPTSYGGGGNATFIGFVASETALDAIGQTDNTPAPGVSEYEFVTVGIGAMDGKTVTTTVTPGGTPEVETIVSATVVTP
jgi:hypothetical protein